jgi:hypothetical protein
MPKHEMEHIFFILIQNHFIISVVCTLPKLFLITFGHRLKSIELITHPQVIYYIRSKVDIGRIASDFKIV